MHSQGVEAKGRVAPRSRCTRPAVETAFAVALVDRHGNLLGASASSGLPGEVEVPAGTNLRERDLRACFGEGQSTGRGRSFPLVSATWVQVKSTRVRVGIYMETGDPCVNLERLDLDLGAVAAIIGSQVVA